MTITSEQKKHFRNIGHNLKPVVTVGGNGLNEGVVAELDRALEDHELIKVKLAIMDRDARKEIAAEITKTCKAELVQEIGKVALFFRAAKKPKLKTSNIR